MRFNSATEAVNYMASVIRSFGVSQPVREVLNEVITSLDFQDKPAAQKQHHAYDGGLAVHTAEVLAGCMALTFTYPEVNNEILIASAIMHDCMKVRDYERNWVETHVVCDEEHPGGWRYTDYCSKIRHVAGSCTQWVLLATKRGVPQDLIDAVAHCILAHHGRKEWGSPVEPQTLEASILNCSDGLSAYYGPGRKP